MLLVSGKNFKHCIFTLQCAFCCFVFTCSIKLNVIFEALLQVSFFLNLIPK